MRFGQTSLSPDWRRAETGPNCPEQREDIYVVENDGSLHWIEILQHKCKYQADVSGWENYGRQGVGRWASVRTAPSED